MATDKEGNIIVAGRFFEAIQLGAEPLESAGEADAFVAAFDRSGNHLWSHKFGDAAAQEATSVSVDASGNVIVTGVSDTSGDHRWSRDFEGTGHNAIGGISADSSNNLVLIGEFADELRVDNEILEHHELPSPWVLKLDASGNTLWAKSYGAHGISFGIAVETDPSNEIVVTGSFSSGIDFDTGTLEAEADAVFLAKLGI